DERRLLGAVPRVTLLAALGNVTNNTGEHAVIEPPCTIPVDMITATLHRTATVTDAAADRPGEGDPDPESTATTERSRA
ncbi:MAG TPA: hypothetical protein VFM66_01620, partial [Agromyces sp.]|nr:hypothetical protein [Agromyces sp.]